MDANPVSVTTSFDLRVIGNPVPERRGVESGYEQTPKAAHLCRFQSMRDNRGRKATLSPSIDSQVTFDMDMNPFR